jgi:hypothetical protein
VTATVTATFTPSPTATSTVTPTFTPTRTVTATRTITATPTATSNAPGPLVTYFGIASGDGCIGCDVPHCQCFGPTPTPLFESGRQVFVESSGVFRIIVEARRGTSGWPVGENLLPTDPSVRPNLQIENTMPMGLDPSEVVDCRNPHPWTGIPGVPMPNFDPGQTLTDNLTDLACRFDYVAFSDSAACTYVDASGDPHFAGGANNTEVQFCDSVAPNGFVNGVMAGAAFPPGDSLLTLQMQDNHGNLGPTAQIVVRVATPTPTPT